MKSNLQEVAAEVRLWAYAPYSRFLAASARSLEDGHAISGYVTLTLTICAERLCAAKAIEQGAKTLAQILIVADTETPIVPCGACRQFLAEFAPSLLITMFKGDGHEFSLSEFQPLPNQGILQVPRGT